MVSDQELHCLLPESSIRIGKKNHLNTPKIVNGLLQLIVVANSFPLNFCDHKNYRLNAVLIIGHLSLGVANNKGADQPVHLHRLVSAFVIRLLENIIFTLATSEISIFYLVSAAEQVGLGMTWLESGTSGFSRQGPNVFKEC